MPEKLKRVFAVLRYIATTISYLYSGFVIYRDEFLSASLAEKYKLGALLGIVFNDTKWWYFFILATVLLFPEILSFFRNKFSKAKISDSSKGLANLESKQEQSEIIFHRMFHHFELTVEGASPEQVINYIKESISASFWYLHISNKVAYDVDWTRSKFYSPQKDNTVVYGIVFHGIKYDLEQREGGVLNRRNGVKIPEMFFLLGTINNL